MNELFQNSEALLFAILGGAIPAILWLWFWLHEEDSNEPEPKGLIIMSFILGGFLVIIAIWLEKYSLNFINNHTVQVIAWATIEEMLKFIGIMIIIGGGKIIREPIDYPMYFIACALGFAALENILYLLHLFDLNGTIVGILTGNLRFLGSTLLHSISSAMIGTALGLSFYLKQYRNIYLAAGIICAIALHSIFNFFIMNRSGENFLGVFGFLWVVAIINILIFEKLKRMGSSIKTINA